MQNLKQYLREFFKQLLISYYILKYDSKILWESTEVYNLFYCNISINTLHTLILF